MRKPIVFVALISILIGYCKFDEWTRPLQLPKFEINKYWGPGDGSKYKEDATVKPFKIEVDEEVKNFIKLYLVCYLFNVSFVINV